jgi:four helix bundle protein
VDFRAGLKAQALELGRSLAETALAEHVEIEESANSRRKTLKSREIRRGTSVALLSSVSSDHRTHAAFALADSLVMAVYRLTSAMPPDERYGLRSHIRRAAVSVATNIVEGSARPKTVEYCRFLHVAHGSARECEYLLSVAIRLRMVDRTSGVAVSDDFRAVAAMLLAAAQQLERRAEEENVGSNRHSRMNKALPPATSATVGQVLSPKP